MRLISYKPQLTTWSPFDRMASLGIAGFGLRAGQHRWGGRRAARLDAGARHPRGCRERDVKLEAAGMKKEDFDISLHDDTSRFPASAKPRPKSAKARASAANASLLLQPHGHAARVGEALCRDGDLHGWRAHDHASESRGGQAEEDRSEREITQPRPAARLARRPGAKREKGRNCHERNCPNRTAAVTRAQREEYILPAVNIHQDAEGYTLEVEMPGVPKSGVEVTFEEGKLALVGRREHGAEEGYTYRESSEADLPQGLRPRSHHRHGAHRGDNRARAPHRAPAEGRGRQASPDRGLLTRTRHAHRNPADEQSFAGFFMC